jgi:hypothetical protein
MVDVVERGKPAMGYIMDLQRKVRVLQDDRRQFRFYSFLIGFGSGAAVMGLWMALR